MIKTVVALSFFASLILSPAYVNAAAPTTVTYVRDYTSGNCTTDDSSGFNAAIQHWASAGGILDLQSGCYNVSSQGLLFGQPGDAPLYGTVKGDGPNLASIHCAQGIGRCLQFNQYWFGHLEGFSVTGAGYGTYAAGDNSDYGLVLSNGAQDLGSQAGSVQDVRVSGFNRCFMLGDDSYPNPSGPGAAAEFTLTNVGGDYCGNAFWFGGNNSGDFILTKPNVTHSGTAFLAGYGAPFQVAIKGGGATNNGTELNIQGDCAQFSMEDYRSEGNSAIPILAGGCPGQKLSLSTVHLNAQPNFAAFSIQLNNGDSQLTVTNSELNGAIEHVQGTSTINLTGNTIASTFGAPVVFSDPNCCGAVRYYAVANRGTDSPNGMYPTGWWPEYSAGTWILPSGSSNTPTPIPATDTPTSTPTATPQPTSTPTATLVPTNTPTPTATPTPTPQWVAPGIQAVSAGNGGDTTCLWRGDCYYGTFTSPLTLDTQFTSAHTFQSVKLTGSGDATSLTWYGSNDGVTWTQIGQQANQTYGQWQEWIFPLTQQVTYSWLRLVWTGGAFNFQGGMLLEP